MKYLFRLQYGNYGYDWFNLESKSRSKCPSINCTSFTSREDLEIEISPIVVHCRSTPTPFFVDGNCVDGNWLPTVGLKIIGQIIINFTLIDISQGLQRWWFGVYLGYIFRTMVIIFFHMVQQIPTKLRTDSPGANIPHNTDIFVDCIQSL